MTQPWQLLFATGLGQGDGQLAQCKAGNVKLIIVEHEGPNRVSEWDDKGKRIREFVTLQTKANDGYAVDPEQPQDLYIPGHGGWLTRFKVDYTKRTWKVDAVLPNAGNDPRSSNLWKLILLRANGKMYLAGSSSYNVYRLDKDGWKFSAALLNQAPSDGMRNPAGLAVDSQNRLWVTEETTNPKRTSVWNTTTGKLVKELVDTTSYSSASSINPDDPTMAFSDNTRLQN